MDISQLILSVIDKTQLQVLAYLLGANLLMGVIAALYKGDFQIARLKDFWKRVLVVFGAYVTVAVAARGLADFAPLATAVWIALIGYLSTQILTNLRDLKIIPSHIMLWKWLER
ncbi:MAG: phage holin family protein [Dehalococcoidia bacterium]|nr:phage holin family protein [Dehalococcoidia bacterium]